MEISGAKRLRGGASKDDFSSIEVDLTADSTKANDDS